jgi:hypothetical protein
MKTLPLDTRPETEKVLISLLRNASTAKKFAQIRSLSQTVLQLSRRAITRANRNLGEEQINFRFLSLHYGKDLAERVEDYLHKKY